MTRHRQSDSADPPLTPEQRVIADILVEKAIAKKSYPAMMDLLEDLNLKPGTPQKILREWQRRQAETGVSSMAEAFDAFLKEIEGVDLSHQEVCVLLLRKVCHLRPVDIECVWDISNTSQMLRRINKKIVTQQNNGKTNRKGRGV